MDTEIKVAAEELEASMSTSFNISKADLISVAKGLGIAVAGAAATYLSTFIAGHDFGAYTPIVVALWSVVINFTRKYVPDTTTE